MKGQQKTRRPDTSADVLHDWNIFVGALKTLAKLTANYSADVEEVGDAAVEAWITMEEIAPLIDMLAERARVLQVQTDDAFAALRKGGAQ